MRKTKKTLAILAIVAMVLAMIPVQVFAATTSAADSDRYAGADRIGTALAVAANWTSADAVVLAPADDANLVDALAAAPLAGQENAPILLTYKAELSADVKAKITALGAKKVYVVGAAANDAVVNALTGVTVEKLTGADRVDTAAAINAKLTSPAGTFVVGYDATPDALSAASYAAANKYAIVLAGPDKNVDASKILGSKTYVVGGTGVVNDVAGATRFGGADRYATNTEVVKGLSYEYSKVYIANGETLVDALVAAPLAAQAKAAVLLANPYSSSVAAASEVNAKLSSTSKVIALGGTGVVSDAVKGSVAYAAPAVLSVESVSAINLKQVEVKFNKEMDKTAAETEANYTVTTTDNGASTTVADATLQADKMTVVLTLTGYYNNQASSKSLTISNVKSVDGQTINSYQKTGLSYIDTTIPTVKSVSTTGPKTIKVYFSEPVDLQGGTFDSADFKIDDGSLAIDGGTAPVADYPTSVVTVTTADDLVAGTHKIEINSGSDNNFADFAGYSVLKQTVEFNHQVPSDAPSATIVSADPTTIKLKYNREIENLDEATVYANYSSITPTVVTKATGTANDGDWDDEWTLTFATPLSGTVSLVIKNENDTKAVDRFDNEVGDQTFAVAVVADTVKPQVTGVEVRSSSQLRISFSEDVRENDAENRYYYTIKKADGTVLNATTSNGATDAQGHPDGAATFTYSTSTDYVDIVLPASLDAGSYQVEVKSIKDLATYGENTMATVTKSFTVKDTSNFQVSSAYFDSGNSKITVTFNKDVLQSGDGSALTAANYVLDLDGIGGNGTEALPDNSTVAIGATNSQVVITLGSDPGIVANAGAQNGDTRIYASVKSSAGLVISPAANVAEVNPKSDSAVVVAQIRNVKLLAANKVSFEVTQPLKSVNSTLITAADDVAATSATYTNQTFSDGVYGALVTVTTASNTLATKIDANSEITDAAANATTNELEFLAGALTNTMSQSNLAFDYVGTAEDVAPARIVSYTTDDNTGNGQIDQITVVYSEDVSPANFNKNAFTVDGYTVTNVYSLNGGQYDDTFVIELQESGAPDTSDTPGVKQVVTAEDVEGNVMAAATSFKTSVDGAAPVVVAKASNSLTGLVITLSEGLSGVANGADVSAAFGVTDTDATGNSPAVATAIYNSTAKTITLTLTNVTATDVVTTDGSLTDGTNVLAAGTIATADATDLAQ